MHGAAAQVLPADTGVRDDRRSRHQGGQRQVAALTGERFRVHLSFSFDYLVSVVMLPRILCMIGAAAMLCHSQREALHPGGRPTL